MLSAALKVARQITSNSPDAVQSSKEGLMLAQKHHFEEAVQTHALSALSKRLYNGDNIKASYLFPCDFLTEESPGYSHATQCRSDHGALNHAYHVKFAYFFPLPLMTCCNRSDSSPFLSGGSHCLRRGMPIFHTWSYIILLRVTLIDPSFSLSCYFCSFLSPGSARWAPSVACLETSSGVDKPVKALIGRLPHPVLVV